MKRKFKCSKKTGIALCWTVAVIIAAIIIVHDNPLADPQDELEGLMLVIAIDAANCTQNNG